MKIRKPWIIKFVAFVASWVIRGWMATLRCRVVQHDLEVHPADAQQQRFIYAFWHESILFPTRFRLKVHVLISHHADGELIARVCRHLRFKTVRGSSNRGGAAALVNLIEAAKTSHLMVTPDGPRGPRRQVQAGLILLAAQTGLPIIPVGVGYRNAWRLGSWDAFAVPCPWTKAVGVAGAAIHVPPCLNRRELERYRELVEARMLEATAVAEARAAERRAVPAVALEPEGLLGSLPLLSAPSNSASI